MEQGTGRARGRARGRASANVGAAAGGPRPGMPPAAAAPPPAWGPPRPQPVPQAAPPPRQPAQPHPQPAGRAAQRVQQPPPAQQAAALGAQMAQMSIQEGGDAAGGGRGARRGGSRALEYTFLQTKPAEVNSKKGTSGQEVGLVANYFKLLTRPKWCLYQYRVEISPEEDRTFVRKSLMRDQKKVIGGYIFDGTVLYTAQRLQQPLELYSRRSEDGETMRLTLKLVGDVPPGDYHYIQVFNIIMRRCYEALKLKLVGRDFFDPEAKVDIREYKMQIWPGYKTTIAQHENEILMVAEIAHKVMRLDTAHDLISTVNKTSRDFQREATEQLCGQVVLTDYNNKTYRIDDVDWAVTPNSTFPMKGQQISYKEYYKKKYQLTITDMSQPMLVSRASARDIRAGQSELIYLVPEFCRMTGLTDQMRANFQLMRAMAQHTRVAPDARVQKLLNFNRRLQTNPEVAEDLKEWDLSLDKNLVQLKGRQYAQEKIVQGLNGCKSYPSGITNDGWTRELRNKDMLTSGTVSKWAIIVPQRQRKDLDNFCKMIMQAGNGVGFRLPPPLITEIPNDSIGVYNEALERVMTSANPNIIVCVVSNDRGDRYGSIKKKSCIERPVPTQVITNRSLTNKNAMSIATKVAIQINCKLGGAPWAVPIPLSSLMVVGYDVCHDTQNKSKSYGAMVASMDSACTRYFSTVSAHTNGEELSNEFGISIKKAVMSFKEANNVLPKTIIIYRDGVGEGQIPHVYSHEVETIKNALASMYNGHNYNMAFIIVSKRLNTRFFSADSRQNPSPGTVIDDVVTSPERYDFFLVSQAVRDGTVAPTSYNIIADTSKLSPDHLQRLTYKMCHLYYNFSGQVRVPAPCQYAHKLAFLVGQHLHRQPDRALSNLLYFL